MWDLKLDTRRLVEGFSTSVLWDRPNILWEKADDWWNDNYVTDSDTAAFLSATGIIDPNKQNYVNNLVIALKTTGLWNKMKAVYPFISEQRNLLNKTEDFSSWSLEVGTLTGGFTDPQGGLTAYKYVNNSSQGLWANQYFTEVSTTYTQSIWVKSVSGGNVNFILASGNGPTGQVNLTATGTWQRVSNTSTLDAGGSIYIRNILDAAGIYVWHPQVELGNLTDYQPTINAQEQFAAAYKYNLKDARDLDAAFRLKIFGGWTFTSTGAKPNGTNAFMDTGLTANLMSQNSAHANFYSRTNNLALIGQVELGSSTGTDYQISIRYDGGYGSLSRLNNSFVGGSYIPTKTAGFFTISRTASTTTKLYEDGVVKATLANASLSPTAINIFISARNDVGSPVLYSTKQCAFSSIGDGLTDTEASNFYTIVQQFQTNLNRAIAP